MRAGVDAARFFEVRAEIAGGSFLLDNSFFAAGIFKIVDANLERMKIDVAVGTVARAETAADAPVFDDDFERVAATDGADRTANHTERVAALAARRGDKEILEAQAISNQASNTVVRISAGVYARVTAGALLKIEDQQALRLHQALREELIDGNALNHLQALRVGGLAFADDGLQARANAGETRDHFAEVVAGNLDKFDVIERGAGGGTDTAAEQTDFTEIVAARDVSENQFAAGIVFGNLHEADANEVEAVGGIALARDDLAGGIADEFDAVLEVVDEVGRELGKHRNASEVGFQGAAAVILIELRAEGFVLHHDVENVAQHFKRDDIGFGADGGGARIEIHASHFAEEVAGAEFRYRTAVGKVDGGIDGNAAIAGFFVALVFLAADEDAGEALEEALRAALRFNVSDGRSDSNLRLAFDDVERRGAEVAFAADDFTSTEAAFDDGASIQFQEGAGDSGKHGHPVQFFGGQGLRGLTDGDRGADRNFVGERAGGAGNHAFAAGDASGIAHRRVEIKSNAGGVAFAHAAEDEIVFDLVATTDAAVAEDAGVVFDGDGEGGIVGTAGGGAARKAWSADASLLGESLEFAVCGTLLAGARRGMVGHQEFEQGLARGENFFGVDADFHARLDRSDARGAEDAGAGVNDTETADADRSLGLQVAQSRNRDAVEASGVEDGGAGGNLDGLAVDGEFDELGYGAHLRSNPHSC